MKPTTIVKINPKIELTFPVLLQCKEGECGGCPNNTGKMLWVPKLWQIAGNTTFRFQYEFFDKSTESTSAIKYNLVESSTSFGNRPTKAYATANNALESNPALSPSLMKLGNSMSQTFDVIQSSSVGFWLFFRQPNPAINNVHDALCFEYNHEKHLITFRSF